jgi:formylglycine-generating enzyme required for sulfatase activity
MGSDQESPDEGPAHEVTLSPFLIDQFEVTHEQFEKVQIPNPSHWQDDPRKSPWNNYDGAMPNSIATSVPYWRD